MSEMNGVSARSIKWPISVSSDGNTGQQEPVQEPDSMPFCAVNSSFDPLKTRMLLGVRPLFKFLHHTASVCSKDEETEADRRNDFPINTTARCKPIWIECETFPETVAMLE